MDARPTNEEVRAVWENIAAWWDDHIGEGNEFQKQLIMPATDRLLEPRAGQTILDIACGNGNYSRLLGRRGARVVACDFAEGFLECARRRTTAADGDIQYVRVDATSEGELLSLGEGKFDSAVCSMAMMDMTTIEPLLRSLSKLLKRPGRLVFSLPHPCFNSNDVKLTAELVLRQERAEQVFGVEIRSYLSERPGLSMGIINQPRPHYFFHRPLSSVFAACFSAGLAVNGLEEPAYSGAAGKNAFSWEKRPELPPAIVVRVVPNGAPRG